MDLTAAARQVAETLPAVPVLRKNMNSRTLARLKFHPALLPLRQTRKLLADLYPSLLLRTSPAKRTALTQEFNACRTVEECIDFTRRHMQAGSCQIASEIAGAIDFINEARPSVMCEIGTFDGGTSLLFTRFVKTVDLMICIDLYVKNKTMLRLLAPPGRTQLFFDAPSYAPATVQRVSRALTGRKLDVLFIDGDHRYEGVMKDFELYSPLVRDGGLVLLHDIVDDRGGARAWAGGVPRIWKELSARFPSREFVHRADQAGFGIGALIYSRDPR